MTNPLRYGSVCSGIEAATCAWHPLGWQAAWLAEIEPFPSAVLKHHYPDVPNLGDMTTIAARVASGEVEAPDILTGGTPCQAFSVAGLRKGLDDARGQLSLAFCRLADAIDAVRLSRERAPAVVVWENVPGVLSDKGNAFGCFLAGLAGEDDPLDPPGGRWANAGYVRGPTRAVAWRILDAQYFGVAQRRRRVWVVASARADFDPAAVLFEFDGVRRDSAPSREAREGAAGCAQGGAVFGGNNTSGPIPVAPALNANRGCHNPGDFEAGALCVAVGVGVDLYNQEVTGEVHCPLRTAGGHGAPAVMQPTARMQGSAGWAPYNETAHLVPVGFDRYNHNLTGGVSGTLPAVAGGASVPCAVGTDCYGITDDETVMDNCLPTMPTPSASGGGHPPAVAFAIQAGALRTNPASGPDGVGVQEGYAYTLEARAEVQVVVGPLMTHSTPNGHGCAGINNQQVAAGHVLPHGMQVRRLTPEECEKLQGFLPGYTKIPWRKKPADQCPDGPRYKALGNSWAVPCAAWIGKRIKDALA